MKKRATTASKTKRDAQSAATTMPGEPPRAGARAKLPQRPLLTPIQAGGLAAVFKVLANDTRLRLLHALVRSGELRVSDLADSIGMKPQAVSNQLQRLADLGIISSRRDGNNIYYKLVDLCVSGLLDQGWCLMEEAGARTGLSERASKCCEPGSECGGA
ncbi:MAG TPA: metalloregulator ArsR/SmtB family transcription factor [Pirellulales bacterium]